MASAVVDALIPRLRQTTATAAKASGILRAAFPDAVPVPSTSSRSSKAAIEVWLPRKKAPTYVLANQQVQPWELLPLKSAAMAQYPNFFNNSCVFFGSMKRDVVGGLQHCLVRPTKLAIDLAKVTRNLGIIEGFEVVQKHARLGEHDFVWQRGEEPQDVRDVKLFKHALLKLHLRSDLYSLRAQDAYRRPSAAAGSGTGAVEDAGAAPESTTSRRDTDVSSSLLTADTLDRSASSSAASTSMPQRRRMGLATVHGQLPLSVKNISKASQPVMMYPSQLRELRQRLPSGIFIMYHHELGLITDAQAEQYDVPALAAAHLGLPLGMVVQIRGAMRRKAAQESGSHLRHVTRLKDWDMVEHVQSEVEARRRAMDSDSIQRARDQLKKQGGEEWSLIYDGVHQLDISQKLDDELLAWQVATTLGGGDERARLLEAAEQRRRGDSAGFS